MHQVTVLNEIHVLLFLFTMPYFGHWTSHSEQTFMQKYINTNSIRSQSISVMHLTKPLHYYINVIPMQYAFASSVYTAFRKTAHLLQSTKGQESQERLFWLLNILNGLRVVNILSKAQVFPYFCAFPKSLASLSRSYRPLVCSISLGLQYFWETQPSSFSQLNVVHVQPKWCTTLQIF